MHCLTLLHLLAGVGALKENFLGGASAPSSASQRPFPSPTTPIPTTPIYGGWPTELTQQKGTCDVAQAQVLDPPFENLWVQVGHAQAGPQNMR